MTGVFYDWQTAERAARTVGHRVRRRGWTDKWLRWFGGLWWMLEDGEDPRVVQATDFGRDEFLATDWTHMPVSCITEIESQTGTACPAPFLPADPGTAPASAAAGSASASASGASVATGYDLKGFTGTPVNRGEPPPSVFVGAGGGGSKSKKADSVWPVLTIGTITDDSVGDCYPGEGTTRSVTFSGDIELSDPANVVAGPYSVHIRVGTEVVWTGTMSPGDTDSFTVTLEGEPGVSSFSLEARAWGPRNAPDITAGGTTPIMKPWCSDSSGEPIGDP
jgi:hypothetical protein